MSSSEGFVIDGLDVNDGITYLLTELVIPPAKKKPIWVTGADSDGAELADEARYENRVVTGRVIVLPQASQDLALAALGALTDKLQEADRGGIDAVWTPNDATKAGTLNVRMAEFDELPLTISDGWLAKSPTVAFSLTCRPFMRGTTVGSYLNLVTNPSFETNTTGWITTGPAWFLNTGATLTRVTAQHQDRTAAGQIVTTAASISQGASYSLGVLPAGSYAFSLYAKGNAGGEDTQLFAGPASALDEGVPATLTTAWARFSGVFAADGVTACYIGLRTITAAVRTVFIDAVQVVAGTTVPAYFDGATGTGYVWVGTADASASAGPNAVVSSLPLATLEVSGVAGDVPADSTLIVTDAATQSRRHVRWGLEAQDYQPATSLLIDSASLATSGFTGATGTRSGAYSGGSNNVITATLRTPAQAICGTGILTHIGAFRVFARIYTTSASTIACALSWQAGDGPFRINFPYRTPVDSGFTDIDLGWITIPAAVAGSQKWSGRILAYSTAGGGETFEVDYLELIPAKEGYGVARAAYSYQPGVLVARDEFIGTTATAALNARVAPLGGTWATSGDATDFVFADNFNTATTDAIESIVRSTAVAETSGRFGILGSTNYTDVQVDARSRIGSITNNHDDGLVARFTNASNHLRFIAPDPSTGLIRIEQVVAGTITVLATTTWSRAQQTSYRLRLIAFASGRAIGQVWDDAGTTLLAQLDATTTVLATGGTLATGLPGIYDRSLSTSAGNRYFTQISVSVPSAEPIVVYPGRSVSFYSDGKSQRLDSTGTYTGDVPSDVGGRFRLRPEGDQGRKNRVAVIARRADIETATDDNIADSLLVQALWTPLYLNTPR